MLVKSCAVVQDQETWKKPRRLRSSPAVPALSRAVTGLELPRGHDLELPPGPSGPDLELPRGHGPVLEFLFPTGRA